MAEKKVDTMVRYSPLEIPKIIKAHYRAGVPVNFVAEPSTVKSEGTMQAAKELAAEEKREFLEWNRATMDVKKGAVDNPEKYFIFADLRASETDIGELRLQDIKSGEAYITFKYNILFAALTNKNAKGILFFDEMNLAPNMIKAQFYKIINDKAIGDIPINKEVLCVSAGNESEHSRGVTEDPIPLVLRRGNYFLRPLNSEEYVEYASTVGLHQNVIGYLGFQPNHLHKIEYDLPDSVGQPCPRTWTKLSAILKANEKLSIQDVEMFAQGLLGPGVGKTFAVFVKSARGINLKDIIANPKTISKYEDDKDLSLMYAIISGVVEEFRSDKKVLKPIFEIASFIKKPEFGAFLLRSAKSTNPNVFMKSSQGGEDAFKLIPPELMDKVVDRYAKYLTPSR